MRIMIEAIIYIVDISATYIPRHLKAEIKWNQAEEWLSMRFIESAKNCCSFPKALITDIPSMVEDKWENVGLRTEKNQIWQT